MIYWLQNSLPAMRNIDDKFEPPKRSTGHNTSQDNFHLFKMSGIGVIKKMHTQRQNSMHTSSNSPLDNNQSILNQMNDCLKECQKVPSLKRKVQETLGTLEQSMMDHRAQIGLQASMNARRRLRDKIRNEEE